MKKYALLIGINGYQLLGKVKYARQDAEAVAEALCRYYGFTDQDITLMSCRGEGATLGLSRYIEHALMSLTDMHDLGLLVFGFWGHGFSPAPGERYLCGVDTMADDLRRTAISFDVVKSKLAQVQAENTLLMLDCCQNRPAGRAAAAAPMTRGEEAALTSLARDIQVAQRDRRPKCIPTVAILNACGEGQKAYEWDSRGHGIFTAHLLDAFAKGFGSIAPLSSWTVDRVSGTARKIHHQEQVPFITIEGKGDIALPVSGSAAGIAPPARRPGLPAQPIISPPPLPAASVEWWAVIDGQKLGPLDKSTMRKMIAGGTITGDSLCWRKDMDRWRPVAGTQEWGASFGAEPAGQAKPGNTKQDEGRLRQAIADDIRQCQAALLTGKGSRDYLEKVHQARFAKWQRAAELGWPEGQWLIGRCYDMGLSVAKDQAEAMKWYRKAAGQGYAAAQYTLGVCYSYGRGVAKDQAEAVKWYRKAAGQGYAPAQYNLGVCYANGDGVAKDQAETMKWYRKAAEQGHASAQYNLGVRYANGDGVTKDQAEAVKWYRKAAEQGHAAAQFNLGRCYYHGDGVAKDQAEAVKWYRKAAEQGDAPAQCNLGVCYDYGRGVAKDQAETMKWYRKAAEQGHAAAQFNLGVRYANGDGVAKDQAETVKWFRKAAGQGHAPAQYNLGVCYANGDGVTKDQDEAMKWYRKAAEQGDASAKAALERRKKSGSCFITTAVCHTLGMADNCRELEVLRSFRDTFMQQTPRRRDEVKEYYGIAPVIVAAINQQPDADELWRELARRFILPCVKLADGRQFAEAHRLYGIMVNELRMKYLPSTTGSNTNTSRKRR